MIYLDNTDQAQTVAIPCELAASGAPVSLSLVSTVDHTVTEVGVIATQSEGGRYWNVTLTLPTMPEGSYEYRLDAAADVIATGCARIGSYAADRKEYNKVIEYKQYDA